MRVIESFNKFIAEGGDPNQYNHEPEVKEEEKKEEEKMEEGKFNSNSVNKFALAIFKSSRWRTMF